VTPIAGSVCSVSSKEMSRWTLLDNWDREVTGLALPGAPYAGVAPTLSPSIERWLTHLMN
jgi:hypothetical protein